MRVFRPGQQLEFDYTNHRGVTEKRRVEFIGLDFGENEWYPDPQWFIRCYDHERQAMRSFALLRIAGADINIIQ